jgi:UDP-glucose 4-epimerase
MKVLLTGGAGFIGSHVADAFLKAGYEVVVLDNLSTGNRENLPAQARLYLLDLGSPEVEKLFAAERPDIVDHHAAQISVTASARDPLEDARTNVLGMLNLLEACRRFPVKKFLFASTGGAIYGDTDRLPTPEDHPPQPLSPYGIHKWLGEQYLRYYAHQHGLAYAVLRYANVYGPRQKPDGEAGVVSIFFSRLLRGETPTLFAYPGEERGMLRDYVYVEDVARANLEAVGKATGETINIGTGVGTATEALYRAIAKRFPGAPEPRREPARPGDLRRSLLDVGKAERLLGWKPKVALSEGLDRTGEFFRSRRGS